MSCLVSRFAPSLVKSGSVAEPQIQKRVARVLNGETRRVHQYSFQLLGDQLNNVERETEEAEGHLDQTHNLGLDLLEV